LALDGYLSEGIARKKKNFTPDCKTQKGAARQSRLRDGGREGGFAKVGGKVRDRKKVQGLLKRLYGTIQRGGGLKVPDAKWGKNEVGKGKTQYKRGLKRGKRRGGDL